MKLRHKLTLVGLLISMFFPRYFLDAQEDSAKKSLGAILRSDAETMLSDAGSIFGAPMHYSDTQWLEAGAVLGGTVVLFSVDESARDLAQRNLSPEGDHLAEIGQQYGRDIYGLALSGGFYAGGLALGKSDLRETGLMTFESILFAGATTVVIKVIAGRSRPYREEGALRFNGLKLDDEMNSFPSGHSTVAFAVSSVLAGRVKNIYASVALYAMAALTAGSRVYHDAHWLSDTFLGAAIGTACGISVCRLHDATDQHAFFRLSPTFNGVRAEITF